MVKQFEGEGLVARRLDPEDNRYTLASLTPAGQQLAAELTTAHSGYQEELLAGITAEDRAVVARVLDCLLANVERQRKESHDRR